MNKKYKYISEKLNKVLRYSSVDTGMTKRDKKLYENSDNTLLLDKQEYHAKFNGRYRNGVNYTDLKTLIIDEEIIKKYVIEIGECTAENIYIENDKNLGGITIPYEFFIDNKSTIKLEWDKTKRTSIEKINILINTNTYPIESKLIENITITTKGSNLIIKIENYNSIIMYIVNSLGEIEKELMARQIKESDIKNNCLDLRDFNEYETIIFDQLKFDKLIINKNILKNINNYKEIFDKLKFNTLDIIDDNDMKLFPSISNIEIKEEDKLKKCYADFYGYYIKIMNKNDIKLIYIDKKDNIVYINDVYLEKKYNMKKAQLSTETYYGGSNKNFMIIILDNNNKYKVIIDDKEYIITETFKNFLLLNKDIYLTDNIIYDIKSNNWFNVLGYNDFRYNGFQTKYNDYLEYKERLKKLKELGLSYNALKYLYDKKINSIINTQTEEGLIDIMK